VRFVPPDAMSWLSFSALRNRFIHGRIFQAASLIMVAQIISQVIRLGGNLIITRLLVPEMFGLMAIVLMIQVTLGLFSDIGLRPAVIQSRRGDDPEFLNTVWTIQIVRGLVIWIACLAIAGGLQAANEAGLLREGTAFGSPELPLILAVTSFMFVIGSFQSTNHMTAGRNLAMPRLIAIEAVSQVTSLTVMISIGYLTGSIWSLVAGAFTQTIVTTVMSHTYLPGIKNRLAWDVEVLKEIAKFAQWVLLSSIAYVISSNLDRAFLGALVSATTLGIYAIALNLYSAVDMLFLRMFENVVLPALSSAARTSHAEMHRQLMRIRPPIDLCYLAISGMLFVMGPTIVSLLYDDRYREAGHMLQVLSFSLIFTRFGMFTMAYLAAGKPMFQAALSTVRLIAIAILVPTLFHFYGLYGALYAIALHPIFLLPVYYWFNRELGLNALKYELMVLPAWPAGYAVGLMLLELSHYVFG